MTIEHEIPKLTEKKMRKKGVVYQSFWMWKRGIQPLPLWLVGWFVIPLENFRAWMQRKRDDDIPF